LRRSTSAAFPVKVAVTTPGGTGTGSGLYTYVTPPAPTVKSITPRNGTALGGTSVTITGTNFTGATAVTFGGTAATGVTVVNATTITAVTPAHAAGVVNVAAVAQDGSWLATGASDGTVRIWDALTVEGVERGGIGWA
jgi:WD40 repeat protein